MNTNTKTLSNFLSKFNNNEELIRYLKSLSQKERELFVFKLFYEGIDRKTISQLNSLIEDRSFKYRDLRQEKRLGQSCGKAGYKNWNNRKRYSDVMENYNSLLEKISLLSKELNLTNSLELSNLFSYLLWNGYLSKTQEHKFQPEGRKLISGLFFADIMDGIGVCANYSDMLKDLLIHCGYPSAVIDNYIANGIEILKPQTINHVFNLIEENNKLYIYDPTNIYLLNIINSKYAKILTGEGISRIDIYSSYSACTSKVEYDLLEEILTAKTFTSPYNRKAFETHFSKNMRTFKKNRPLIKDFYDEARSDIVGISEKTDKIKIRQRII